MCSTLFFAPNQVSFWENEFFNASVKRVVLSDERGSTMVFRRRRL